MSDTALNQNKKDMQIQTIKGICMILVCFIHVLSDMNLNPYLFIVIRTIVNFCTGLFFFISAYLVNIDRVKNQTKSYLLKRIIHLYAPFIFYSLCYTLYSKLYDFSSIGGIVKTFIRMFIGANAPQLYFIIMLIFFTLICPLLIRIIQSNNILLNVLVFCISPIYLIATFIGYMGVDLFSINRYLPSAVVTVLPFTYLICYYLGLYFKIKGFPKFNSMFLIPITFVIALIVNITEYKYMSFPIDYIAGQRKLINIIFIFSIMINFDKILVLLKKFNTKIIEKISDYSFGIFFIHILVIRVLFRIANFLNINYLYNTAVSILSLIVITSATVVISWLILFVMSRIVKPKFIKTILCLK